MIFTCYDNNKIFFHKGMDFAKSFEAPELRNFSVLESAYLL